MRIEGNDRQALERLLRYCARPCWSAQRLHEAGDGAHLIYVLPKPGFDGLTQITLTPLELLERLAKFIPPPRRLCIATTGYSPRTPSCALPWRNERGRQ